MADPCDFRHSATIRQDKRTEVAFGGLTAEGEASCRPTLEWWLSLKNRINRWK